MRPALLENEKVSTLEWVVRYRMRLLQDDLESPLVKESFMVSSCLVKHVEASHIAALALEKVMSSTTSSKVRKTCLEALVALHDSFVAGLTILEKGKFDERKD